MPGTVQEIKEVLMKKLGDKKASSIYSAGEIVCEYLRELGVSENILKKVRIDTKQFSAELYVYTDLRRDKETFARIDGKRKKGAVSHDWLGSYADYTWKDFDITLYRGDDIVDALNTAVEVSQNTASKNRDDMVTAYECYQLIRQKLGGVDLTREVIKQLYNNLYAFEDRYEKR